MNLISETAATELTGLSTSSHKRLAKEDVFHFLGEVCLQLCGAPYRLFTKGAMAGSWVLLHPTNTSFAERVAAVRQNNWLQHQGITKAQREHGFRLL